LHLTVMLILTASHAPESGGSWTGIILVFRSDPSCLRNEDAKHTLLSWQQTNMAESTGHFTLFSVITNIITRKPKDLPSWNCSQPQENWKSFFWQLEMFDVCIMGDTAHIDTIF
jgi:hypothetical protein